MCSCGGGCVTSGRPLQDIRGSWTQGVRNRKQARSRYGRRRRRADMLARVPRRSGS